MTAFTFLLLSSHLLIAPRTTIYTQPSHVCNICVYNKCDIETPLFLLATVGLSLQRPPNRLRIQEAPGIKKLNT